MLTANLTCHYEKIKYQHLHYSSSLLPHLRNHTYCVLVLRNKQANSPIKLCINIAYVTVPYIDFIFLNILFYYKILTDYLKRSPEAVLGCCLQFGDIYCIKNIAATYTSHISRFNTCLLLGFTNAFTLWTEVKFLVT